jgi:hypothetical protein
MNATEVITALRVHYGDGFRLVEQVADHTGFRASRWLDAMAFGLWPSRGLEIHGIEVKVSRADFRREIEAPAKADATASRCDRFWIAAPAGIVDPLHLESLAPAWGLLEVVEDRAGKRTVRTTKKAERTDAKPVDRDFLAAVLRRIPGVTDAARAEIRAEVERENETEIARLVAAGLARETNGYAALRETVATFEAAAGIHLRDYQYGGRTAQLGHALRLIEDELGGWQSARNRLNVVADQAQRRGDDVTAAAARVRELVAALDDVLGLGA